MAVPLTLPKPQRFITKLRGRKVDVELKITGLDPPTLEIHFHGDWAPPDGPTRAETLSLVRQARRKAQVTVQ
jgi:hypothetical protein